MWRRRGEHDARECCQIVRRRGRILQIRANDLASRRQQHLSTEDLTNRGELECELGYDSEVATTTPDRPEEIRMLTGTCGHNLAVSCDNLRGDEVVDS